MEKKTIIPIELYILALENLNEDYSYIAIDDINLLEICQVLVEDGTGIKIGLAERILEYYKAKKLECVKGV